MVTPPKNRPSRPRWLLPLLGCGIVGVLAVIAAAAIVTYYLLGAGSISGTSSGFNAEQWRQATMGCRSDNPRLGMYSGLAQKLVRERPTEAEVVALLGNEGGTTGNLSYQLGLNLADCDAMQVNFGSNGRVSDVRYIQG